MTGDIILAVITGISLSAACGFRVFVPMLAISLASVAGYIELAPGYAWMTSVPAIISFSVAVIFEIAGYYNPWIDNALDVAATPISIIAGVVATGALITGMNPLLEWTTAIICGGGAATFTQFLTIKARALSSLFSGGIANPIFSTVENIFSVLISITAIIVPAVSLIFLVLISVFILLRNKRKEKIKKARMKL